MKASLTTLLAFTILIGACKKTITTNSVFDENIKIRMVENVDSTKRTLTLNCYTEKSFECSNFSIKSSFLVTNNKVTLNFTEIYKPDICFTSFGPATVNIDLGTLGIKTYELELNIGSSKISGQITVTNGNFKVTLPNQTKVQFINPDLNRVADHTIYGTVHYHSTTTDPLVQKYIDSLQYYGAVATNYTPGDYGNFQIEPNGQIRQTQDGGYYYTRYYIFNFTNSSAQLKALVKRFGLNYPTLLLVTLITTKGETFYSWVP